MKEPKIIGFIIEGDNLIVCNPCTIPIEFLEDVLKKEREKGKITFIAGIQLPIKFHKLFGKKLK